MMILDTAAAEEWNALVEQEENPAYQVHPPASSLSLYQQLHINSCPKVWREKICEWQFQVIDHCDIDRDVVSISLSYFDRYISRHTSIDETLYQLVAMTSLYLAVKLHSTRKISVSSMSALSKGHFRVDQIEKMEISLIKTLRWRLNPSTPSILLNIASPIIDASSGIHEHHDPQVPYEILELSRYLLELGVCDGFFTDKRPSSVAYASILVAMDRLSTSANIKAKLESYHLDKSPVVTNLCAQRLSHVYSLAVSTKDDMEPRGASSPTSILG